MGEQLKPSNSRSLVDRVSERILASDFGTFITEDEAGELIKDAIERAFFKEEPTTDGYGRVTGKKEAPIVAMVRERFTPKITAMLDEAIKELSKRPEVQQALTEVAIASLPDLLLNYGRRLAGETHRHLASTAVESVLERIRNGGLQQQNHGYQPPPAEQVVGTEGKHLPPA